MSGSPPLKGGREPTSTLPMTTKCIPVSGVNGYKETASSPRNDGRTLKPASTGPPLVVECVKLGLRTAHTSNTTAEALSGQKPANRSFCILVASGFPWGGCGCQVGANIDPDQLAYACKEELIAECLCSTLGGGDASVGGCPQGFLVLICGHSALLPQPMSPGPC